MQPSIHPHSPTISQLVISSIGSVRPQKYSSKEWKYVRYRIKCQSVSQLIDPSESDRAPPSSTPIWNWNFTPVQPCFDQLVLLSAYMYKAL